MIRFSSMLGVALLLLCQTHAANAIIVRHDRADKDYVQLAGRFPAAVTILPDGSGALIGPKHVLTAAHVARGIGSRNPHVMVGGKEVSVDRIFIHPEWKDHGAHDIAVLRLAEPVEGVTPAVLFRGDDEVGRIATFVGAGDTGTGESGPKDNDGQRRGATNRVDNADTNWVFFTFDSGEDATELEGVSGPGDSGGPAFIEENDTTYVLGVSVFNFNGKPGRYGTGEGYTRVSTHVDWIESVLAGKADPAFAPAEAR